MKYKDSLYLRFEILRFPFILICPCDVDPVHTPLLYSKIGVYRGIHFSASMKNIFFFQLKLLHKLPVLHAINCCVLTEKKAGINQGILVSC